MVDPTETLVLEGNPTGTSSSLMRRQMLNAGRLPVPGVALEVGAFDNPTLHAEDGFAVRYADYFSAEELRVEAARNPRRSIERMVGVDYVIKGPRLSPFIPESIGLLVANHVVEHLPDPIGWLRDVALMCTDDAAIFMAVPDRRYTFDLYKQPSDIVSLVRAFDERKEQPDAYDIARMRYLHQRVDAKAVWASGKRPPMPGRTEGGFRKVMEQAAAQAAAGYVDVHCHYYTAGSFLHIFTELFESGYLPWKVELVGDVQRGSNEFHVVFRRTPEARLP